MGMKEYESKIKLLTDTPYGYTLTMIGGKWRLVILYWLIEYETIRYNELQRLIGAITPRTLSKQLREMEVDSLIVRKEYPQISPKAPPALQ